MPLSTLGLSPTDKAGGKGCVQNGPPAGNLRADGNRAIGQKGETNKVNAKNARVSQLEHKDPNRGMKGKGCEKHGTGAPTGHRPHPTLSIRFQPESDEFLTVWYTARLTKLSTRNIDVWLAPECCRLSKSIPSTFSEKSSIEPFDQYYRRRSIVIRFFAGSYSQLKEHNCTRVFQVSLNSVELLSSSIPAFKFKESRGKRAVAFRYQRRFVRVPHCRSSWSWDRNNLILGAERRHPVQSDGDAELTSPVSRAVVQLPINWKLKNTPTDVGTGLFTSRRQEMDLHCVDPRLVLNIKKLKLNK